MYVERIETRSMVQRRRVRMKTTRRYLDRLDRRKGVRNIARAFGWEAGVVFKEETT